MNLAPEGEIGELGMCRVAPGLESEEPDAGEEKYDFEGDTSENASSASSSVMYTLGVFLFSPSASFPFFRDGGLGLTRELREVASSSGISGNPFPGVVGRGKQSAFPSEGCASSGGGGVFGTRRSGEAVRTLFGLLRDEGEWRVAFSALANVVFVGVTGRDGYWIPPPGSSGVLLTFLR